MTWWFSGFVLLVSLALSAHPVRAQGNAGLTDSLTWELVGQPVDGEGLFADTARGAVYVNGYDGLFVIHPGETNLTRIATIDGDELDTSDQDVFVSRQGTLFANGVRSLRRSADGGQTWKDALSGPKIAPVYTPSGTLVTNRGGTGGNIVRSTDDGLSWTIIKTFDTIPFGFFPWAFASLSVSETLPQGRLVAAGNGGLAYSDDDGFSWHETNVFGAFAYRSVSVIRAPWTLDGATSTGTLYAAVNGAGIAGGFYESTDGATWHLVGQIPGVHDYGAEIISVGGAADSVLFAIAPGLYDEVPVYRSRDRGRSWEAVRPIPAASVLGLGEQMIPNELAVGPEGRLWVALSAAGPAKGAVFRTAEVVVPVGVERPEVPGLPGAGEAVLVVWPNPVEGEATVGLTLSQRSAVQVGVYDVLGREVAVLHEGDLAAGDHRFAFEAEGLPVGVYFVRVAGEVIAQARALTVAR